MAATPAPLPISVGAVSKPPPGFSAPGVITAVSPSLTADEQPDDVPAQPEPAAEVAPPVEAAPVYEVQPVEAAPVYEIPAATSYEQAVEQAAPFADPQDYAPQPVDYAPQPEYAPQPAAEYQQPYAEPAPSYDPQQYAAPQPAYAPQPEQHVEYAPQPAEYAQPPVEYAPDPTAAPAAEWQPTEEAEERELIGGSALLTAVVNAVPRPSDLKLVGRDVGATLRIAGAALVALVLLVIALPPLVRALGDVPVIGSAFNQLESLSLYPGSYGVMYFTGLLGLLGAAGVVIAQMERTAHGQGLRQDPERRLNIAVAGLLAIVGVSGLLTLLRDQGWAAAAAATGFFVTLCLIVPLGNLPGARVMRAQSERAWALLLGLGVLSLLVEPTIPALLIVVLAFTRVRTHWAAVRDGEDESEISDVLTEGGRRATMALLAAALLASSLGALAMTEDPVSLRQTDAISPTAFPGATEGPTITPPSTGMSPTTPAIP